MVRLCRLLNRIRIRYVVAGGIAAILYGVHRVTTDIDVILDLDAASEQQLHRLVKELQRHGYRVSQKDLKAALADRGHVTVFRNGYRIDFKPATTSIDQSTLAHRIPIEVQGIRVWVTPLEELIAVKLRELAALKDVEDALQLMYLYYDQLDWQHLHQLTGGDPLNYANELLATILNEFPESKRLHRQVKELKQLKRRLEQILKKK